MGTRKWSRVTPLLVSFLLVLVIVYLLYNKQDPVIVITPQRTELRPLPAIPVHQDDELRIDPGLMVPRGQSYFYNDEYADRLGSFEVWRPPRMVQQSRLRERYWKQALYLQNSKEGKENVFVIMITNTRTMWTNIPTQQQTMFRHFTHYGLYGNSADSIGGKEIVDALKDTETELLEKSKSFETYRILKAIRRSHSNIGSEQVTLSDVSSLRRFTLLPALLRAYQDHRFDHDWFVVTDDDTTIFERNLRDALSKLDPKQPLYLGSAVQGPNNVFASSGSVIVLSREAMRRAFDESYFEDSVVGVSELVNNHYAKLTENECCGDLILAIYLKEQANLELDIEKSSTLFQGLPITSVSLGTNNWCTPICSLGKQRPRDMELVAEYEAIKAASNEKILYSDIYLDFVKPYIYSTPQHNWDNGAKDIELEPGSESLAYPNAHKSLENCEEACLGTPQCVMFRYDAYKQYCGLGVFAVALGKPVLMYDSAVDAVKCKQYKIRCEPRGPHLPMSSMWLIPRIQEMRQSMECDILYRDKTGEGVQYGALDQTEGWWHRVKD